MVKAAWPGEAVLDSRRILTPLVVRVEPGSVWWFVVITIVSLGCAPVQTAKSSGRAGVRRLPGRDASLEHTARGAVLAIEQEFDIRVATAAGEDGRQGSGFKVCPQMAPMGRR